MDVTRIRSSWIGNVGLSSHTICINFQVTLFISDEESMANPWIAEYSHSHCEKFVYSRVFGDIRQSWVEQQEVLCFYKTCLEDHDFGVKKRSVMGFLNFLIVLNFLI